MNFQSSLFLKFLRRMMILHLNQSQLVLLHVFTNISSKLLYYIAKTFFLLIYMNFESSLFQILMWNNDTAFCVKVCNINCTAPKFNKMFCSKVRKIIVNLIKFNYFNNLNITNPYLLPMQNIASFVS